MIEGLAKNSIRVRTTRGLQPHPYETCSTPKARHSVFSHGSLATSRVDARRPCTKHNPRMRSYEQTNEIDDGLEFSDLNFKCRVSVHLLDCPNKKRMVIQPITTDYNIKKEITSTAQAVTPIKQRHDTTDSKQSESFKPLVCMMKELLEPPSIKRSSRSPLVKLRKRKTDNPIRIIPEQSRLDRLEGWQEPQPLLTDDLVDYTRRLRRRRAPLIATTIALRENPE